VGAKIQGDYSSLEVYVYEEEKCNLFVHHEITLSGFPLCLEFLPINPLGGTETLEKGNFLLVGTFLPEIEIWNLDVLNTIEPTLILGDDQASKSKKKKKDKLQGYYGHTDAVMSLHVNPSRR
jgi:periodic tryptophan protein 1